MTLIAPTSAGASRHDPCHDYYHDHLSAISSVLHYRLQQVGQPDLRHDATWAQRTPVGAPLVAHELAAALDDRARALGEQLAVSPEPWLARQLGVLAPGASPALREEYSRRAGTAAAYREAAGITNPEQAVSLEPHRGNAQLEAMRKAVFSALEIRDEADIIRALDRGQLEAVSSRITRRIRPMRPIACLSPGWRPSCTAIFPSSWMRRRRTCGT
jgi:hypothetical protein